MKADKKKRSLAERIYRVLYTGNKRPSLLLRIYPDPKPDILALIQREIER